MRHGILKIRKIVAEHRQLITVTGLLIGLIALGGAGWMYTHPQKTTITEPAHKQTFQSTVQTSAVVTEQNDLYRQGRQLTNQPVYLLKATPNATVTMKTRVPEEQAVRVEQKLAVVYTATHDGDQFWSKTRVLAANRTTTSTGHVITRATLSLPQIESRVQSIKDSVKSAGTVHVFLRRTVDYQSDRYSGSLSGKVELNLNQQSYAFSATPLEQTHSKTVTRTITIRNKPWSLYIGLTVVGFLALIMGVSTGIQSFRDGGPQTLDHEIEKERFRDWVSKGELPGFSEYTTIEMASLEDLVDVAIDSEKRVVYDAEKEVYAVIDGEQIYYYIPFQRSDHHPPRPDDR